MLQMLNTLSTKDKDFPTWDKEGWIWSERAVNNERTAIEGLTLSTPAIDGTDVQYKIAQSHELTEVPKKEFLQIFHTLLVGCK